MPSPLLPLPELEIRASSLAAQGRPGATGGRRRLLAVLGLPPAKRRGGGGGTLTARGPEPAPCPGGRTHQPGVRTWPLLACPQERRPGARREEGALQPPPLVGANLSGLSARSCFPQHSIYFPQRRSQFLIFCRIPKPGLLKLSPRTFPRTKFVRNVALYASTKNGPNARSGFRRSAKRKTQPHTSR